MIVTVFRSRLKPGVKDEYVALATRMAEIAVAMPGYVSHKGFWADDGERAGGGSAGDLLCLVAGEPLIEHAPACHLECKYIEGLERRLC